VDDRGCNSYQGDLGLFDVVRTVSVKSKSKNYFKHWYERNKVAHRQNIKKNYDAMRTWLQDYKKELCCSRCGESRSICLDFHHREPDQKDLEIAQALRQGWSKQRILAEIDKCEVLCANCHRKLHWGAES
jgi:hypothetical protein